MGTLPAGVTRHGNFEAQVPGSWGSKNIALITRPRDLQDKATPSGNTMAVITLLKLAGFTNEFCYVDSAHQAVAQMQTPTGGGVMSLYPLGFDQWLQARSYALSQPPEAEPSWA